MVRCAIEEGARDPLLHSTKYTLALTKVSPVSTWSPDQDELAHIEEGAHGQTTKHGSPERIDANASLQLAAPSLKSRRLRAVDRCRN